MNGSLERVVRYLAGNNDLESVPVVELEKLRDEHPFFPIVQLLLAKKLKGCPESEYLKQVQKTALYFSNPYWLQYLLLQDNENEPGVERVEAPFSIATDARGEGKRDEATKFVSNYANPNVAPIPTNNINQEQGNTLVTDYELMVEPAENGAQVAGNTSKQAGVAAQPGTIQADEEMGVTARDTSEEVVHFTTELEATVPGAVSLTSLHFPVNAEAEVVALEEEMVGAVHATDHTTSEFLEEAADRSTGLAATGEDDEHDRMFQNIKAMLDASSEEADADTKDAVIPIDPYYTIDYFASQGIKLELDQNPQDQLGQNLKKFTHWLRHMKKLGPEDATEVINRTGSEAEIQQIADSSNTVREVVTEAMALVMEKQGKYEKAIELYNKLSFLNPDKRTYFADKIKKLKGT